MPPAGNKKAAGTTAETPKQSNRWTDAEKVKSRWLLISMLEALKSWLIILSPQIALLVSIAKSYEGAVNWSKVNVPAGRTLGTCTKQYQALVATAETIPMTESHSTPTKKRKAANVVNYEKDDAASPKAKRGKASKVTKVKKQQVDEPDVEDHDGTPELEEV